MSLSKNNSGTGYNAADYPLNYELIGESPSPDELKIFIDDYTFSEIDSYLSGDMNRELGGVLLGSVHKDLNDNIFVIISDFIPALYTESSATRLTFTHKTWEYINSRKEKYHKDKIILGWFHSHPGYSVFMSTYDNFIQDNFFNLEFMVSYIYDPKSKEKSFYFNKNGAIKAKGYYVIKRNITDLNFELTDDEKKNVPFTYKDTGNKITIILITLIILNIIIGVFYIIRINNSYNKTEQAIINLDSQINNVIEDVKNINEKYNSIMNYPNLFEDSVLFLKDTSYKSSENNK